MRALIQRVSSATVFSEGEELGRIQQGILVLLGVGKEDTEQDADWLAEKILHLRMFTDDEQKMNLSVQDVSGSVLVVSQFTLYADVRKGARPSFFGAADAEVGNRLYEYFVQQLYESPVAVETGEFGATMQVELVNDGPVTLLIDSRDRS